MTKATSTTRRRAATYVRSASSFGIAVLNVRPRSTPRQPGARISRSTANRATSIPSRFSCFQSFGAPCTRKFSSKTCWISTFEHIAPICPSSHPFTQRVRRTASLLRDRPDRRPLRALITLVLENQSDHPFRYLGRISSRLAHCSSLSKEWSFRESSGRFSA